MSDDFSIDSLKQLVTDLEQSHISALLSPEKLARKEWYESAGFVRQTCVTAAWDIREMLEDTARLDWLEDNSFKAQKVLWDKHCGEFTVWTLRQAIDAARKERG